MSNPPWIPLENNPQVLNSWSERAGLVITLAQFEDIFGLDPELLQLVNQPVKAVLLLFPISESLEAKRREEELESQSKGQSPLDPTILFIKQTVSNACGTIGLLHALANSDMTFFPGSPLAQFIQDCQGKTPDERAKLLETTALFADIHATAANEGQTQVPTDLETNLHFTCFIQAPASRGPEAHHEFRVVELDGRRAGPVDRGVCVDLLKDVAKIVKEVYIGNTSSLHFSMTALTVGAGAGGL